MSPRRQRGRGSAVRGTSPIGGSSPGSEADQRDTAPDEGGGGRERREGQEDNERRESGSQTRSERKSRISDAERGSRGSRGSRSSSGSGGGASTNSRLQYDAKAARNAPSSAASPADNASQRRHHETATPLTNAAEAPPIAQQRRHKHRLERPAGQPSLRLQHGKGATSYREQMVLQPSATRRIIVDSAEKIAKSFSFKQASSSSLSSSSLPTSSSLGKQSFSTSPLAPQVYLKQFASRQKRSFDQLLSEQKLIKATYNSNSKSYNNNNNRQFASLSTDNSELTLAKENSPSYNSNLSSPFKTTTTSITKMADQAVIDKLEAGFAKLQASTPEQCHSLLKKYLTRDVLDKLKGRKTAMGATLLDVAQSGFENLDSGVGIYAPDAESYTLFAELFNPIIEDYHGGFKASDKHPQSDFGNLDTLVNVDPNNEFVISTRVRCGRSLKGYPFNPCLNEAQYKEMESKVSTTLKEVEGDLAGTYYPLTGMTKETQQQLIDDHFLFKEGDRFLQAANACRYWPTGRGIYHNAAKTFLVWVNEEDHLRIISMQKGGDLKTVFGRLVQGVRAIEARVPFSRDDRLGFLTFCPTNLGTTIRASVHIKLPKLAADRKKLEEVAGRYNLQVRGTSGEHTESIGGIYDISNKRRLGLTEYQAVKEMQDGILELIKIEKSL